MTVTARYRVQSGQFHDRKSLVGADMFSGIRQGFGPLLLPFKESSTRSISGIATNQERSDATFEAPGIATSNKKLLGTSASLLVTSALLVTRSY